MKTSHLEPDTGNVLRKLYAIKVGDVETTMADKIFLLDRSGSMESCWDDTIGGFNSFVSEQKQFGGKLTLVQFDHEIMESFSDTPINDVKPLTRVTFTPRGSTALLDAIGKTIKKYENASNITCIILTDGYENASRTYTKPHIKDLISQKTKDGWTFMYLGANQDAFAEANSLGINAPGCAMSYESSNTPEVFRALSATLSQQN